MSIIHDGPIVHPVSYILAEYLISVGVGVDMEVAYVTDDVYGIATTNTPQTPDSLIIVSDTTPIKQGRDMLSDFTDRINGCQILVRDNCYDQGWAKIREVSEVLDQVKNLPFEYLHHEDTTTADYRIHGVHTSSGPIPLGQEYESNGQSKRYLFSHNVLVNITPDNP